MSGVADGNPLAFVDDLAARAADFVTSAHDADRQIRVASLAAASPVPRIHLVSRTKLSLTARVVVEDGRVVLFFLRHVDKNVLGSTRLDLSLAPSPDPPATAGALPTLSIPFDTAPLGTNAIRCDLSGVAFHLLPANRPQDIGMVPAAPPGPFLSPSAWPGDWYARLFQSLGLWEREESAKRVLPLDLTPSAGGTGTTLTALLKSIVKLARRVEESRRDSGETGLDVSAILRAIHPDLDASFEISHCEGHVHVLFDSKGVMPTKPPKNGRHRLGVRFRRDPASWDLRPSTPQVLHGTEQARRLVDLLRDNSSTVLDQYRERIRKEGLWGREMLDQRGIDDLLSSPHARDHAVFLRLDDEDDPEKARYAALLADHPQPGPTWLIVQLWATLDGAGQPESLLVAEGLPTLAFQDPFGPPVRAEKDTDQLDRVIAQVFLMLGRWTRQFAGMGLAPVS